MAGNGGNSNGGPQSGENSNGDPQSASKNLLDPIPPAPEQEQDDSFVYKFLNWKSEDTDDSLIISVDVPGLAKEHVKVCIDESSLIIEGENQEEDRSYGGTIDLPKDSFQMDRIKPVVKNGILTLFIPKVKKPAKDLLYLDVE